MWAFQDVTQPRPQSILFGQAGFNHITRSGIGNRPVCDFRHRANRPWMPRMPSGISGAAMPIAGPHCAPDLRHRLKSFIGIGAQPDRSSWHYCPLTLKGNGEGILGHNFGDKCRESDEWQTISMVVGRIQLTWHQPGTRKRQATRQTTLYVPLSIFGCL